MPGAAAALLLTAVAASASGGAPLFLVAPYLQSPGPDRMTVMFETVEPGLLVEHRPLGSEEFSRTPAERETRAVQPVPDPVHYFERQSLPAAPQTNVFKAAITGLRSNTVYEYRVLTAAGYSPTYRFKTWPVPADGVDTGRFILISDSQGNNPDWLQSIVEEGVIARECEGEVHRCVERIAAVVIPGDIVDVGTNSVEWREQFFAMGRALFSYVPILPAIGNHDYTIENYLTYFELPDNGSERHREEWYAIDYLNFRLLTLQSNPPANLLYASLPPQADTARATIEQLREKVPGFARLHEEQSAWVAAQIADAKASQRIDYVFASIHHPCKSELWMTGESAITCSYKKQLEELSAETGRITGHLFGHTHAYSRGQSRDVPHLWLDAASAGGAIDDWGEYDQADYDEIETSWDEYGYAMMEFATRDTPEIRVVRRAGGDDHTNYPDRYSETHIRDAFAIGGENQRPDRPRALAPAEKIGTADALLTASEFVDSDGDPHLESHWQLRTSSGDYAAPLLDAWGNESRARNTWFRENLQEGVSLTHWRVPYLVPGGSYCWRVRYRDARLAWSELSEESCFEVTGVLEGPDRVVNGGAEEGTVGWVVLEGILEAVSSGDCGTGTVAFAGERFFAVGGVCGEASGRAVVRQRIDVSNASDEVDSARVLGVLRVALRDDAGWDVPVARLRAFGSAGEQLGEAKPLINQTGAWRELASSLWLPPGTRALEVELSGLRQHGAGNDSYVDAVRFHLAVSNEAPVDRPTPTLSPGNGMALR